MTVKKRSYLKGWSYLRRLLSHARQGGWRQARDFIHRERLRRRNPVLDPTDPRWPILPLPGTIVAPTIEFLQSAAPARSRLISRSGLVSSAWASARPGRRLRASTPTENRKLHVITRPANPHLHADAHSGGPGIGVITQSGGPGNGVTTQAGTTCGRWVQVHPKNPVRYVVTDACRELQPFIGAEVVASQVFNPWGLGEPRLPALDPQNLPPLEEAAGRAKISQPGEIDPSLLIAAPATVTSWPALLHGPRHVRLILATIRPHRLPEIAKQLRALRLPPGITMAVTVGIHGEHRPDVRILDALAGLPIDHVVDLPAQWSLGRCLNHLIALGPADILAKIDDDDHYQPEYLAEAIHALDFSGAAVVGKRSYPEISYQAGREISRRLVHPGLCNQYTNHVAGSSLVFPRATWQRHPFSDRTVGEDSHFLRAVVAGRGLVYATSPHNFAVTRHDEGHTWQPEQQ